MNNIAHENKIYATYQSDPYRGTTYNDISRSQIMRTFEETDVPYDDVEEKFNDYARTQMSDFRPDTNKFEYEDARGGVNQRAGVLQLRHEGHRGNGNWERPEMFLGFGGPEDHDPRGVATGPDFKLLKKQENFRTKYTRFSAENDQNVTGGGRSESRVISDNQNVFKWRKDSLKVFDRQLDGRRNALQRQYIAPSEKRRVIETSDYGEKITSDAMVLTRTPKIILRESRNEREWRTATWDQDYDIVRYATNRRTVNEVTENKVSAQAQDEKFVDADICVNKRAAKMVIKDLVVARTCTQHDIATGESQTTVVMKQKKLEDLAIILGAIKQDANFHNSDHGVTYRTPAPQAQRAQVTYLNPDQEIIEINKEIILKSVKPGNARDIQQDIISDSNFADTDLTPAQKSAKMRVESGRKLKNDYDAEQTEHLQTYNYKTAQMLTHGLPKTEVCMVADADLTQIRKTDQKVGRFTYRDVDTQTNFLDNATFDRLAGKVGAKYTNRYVDRDGTTAPLSGLA